MAVQLVSQTKQKRPAKRRIGNKEMQSHDEH
jgi:hypothetical protein